MRRNRRNDEVETIRASSSLLDADFSDYLRLRFTVIEQTSGCLPFDTHVY